MGKRDNGRGILEKAAVIALLSAVYGFGQVSVPDSMPQRGILPTGGYAVSDLESINVANGNLTYRIPLTSLPPGRAGWSAGVNLTYNSQVYDLGFEQAQDPNQGYATHDFQVLTASQTGGGWQYGFTYSLDLEQRPLQSIPFSCSDATNQPWKIYRMSLITPDGSHHTLYLYPNTPSMSPGEVYRDINGEGYYDVFIGGQYYYCPQTAELAAGNVTYYTADGSYLRVVLNNTPGQYLSNTPWTIYLADGRTVTGTGFQTSALKDRSGNAVTITNTYDPNDPNLKTSTTLADDLGRTITIQYNTGAQQSQDIIQQTGADGSVLQWTVSWAWKVAAFGLQYACDVEDNSDYCPLSGIGQFPSLPSVSSINLPTGQSFSFGYDTSGGWGEMNQVTLPSGATVQYAYRMNGYYRQTMGHVTENAVLTKTLNWTDENVSQPRTEVTNYCVGYITAGCTANTVTNVDGGVIRYVFTALTSYTGNLGNQLVAKQTNPDGSTDEKIWAQNPPYALSSSTSIYPGNPYVQYEIHSVASGGSPSQAAATSYVLDRNGNQTQKQESDWFAYSNVTHNGSGSPTGLSTTPSWTRARTDGYAVTTSTTASFTTDDSNGYFNPSLSGLPWGLLVSDGVSGAGPGSSSTYQYGDTSGHPNLIQENHWDSTISGLRSTSYTYDAYGNLLSMTNPRNVTTSWTYDGSSLCLTGKTQASGQPEGRSFSYGCSGNSWGLIGTETDNDHTITRTFTYDKFGRTTQVLEQGGGVTRTQATTYNDAGRTIMAASDLNANGDGLLHQTTWYDQLARVRQTLDAAGNTVQTSYYTPQGAGYNYQLVSNPYASMSDSTMGWMLTTRDTSGRPISVGHFAGSGTPAPWSSPGNTNNTGTAQYAYSANTTTITDEAGVIRTNTVDGLGRLTQVGEGSPVILTGYGYDALDNLTNVMHPADATHPSGETRTFTYSSLSRLVSAANPENGTVSYTYDANGNLATRVQAGVTTSYGYDLVDELTGKTYSDYSSPNPTPWVSYGYAKGWRTSVNAGPTNTQFGHDGLGRVNSSTQTTNATTYPTLQYGYNLADEMTSETYPSGRVVTTTYDSAGRPSGVIGSDSGGQTNYASAVQYAAQGAPKQVVGGDQITRTWTYNTRFQTSGIVAANGSGQLLNLGLTYSATQNNGNVLGQTIVRPPVGVNAAQTYGYDYANRLSSAGECNQASGCSFNWSQTYVYDVVGNQALLAGSSVVVSALTPQTSSTSTVPYDNSNHWLGVSYNGAGSMVGLSTQTFTYDAEQRLIQQTDSTPPASSVTFAYDGDGNRVMKASGTLTTTYVYDAQRNVAAEYNNAATAAWSGTQYLTTDHLGSVRLVTDGTGAVVGCHDYLPFGVEIPQGWGRTGVGCYGALDTVLRFTGKERDAESGLDYFQTRYFSSAQGRFTSPDKPLIGQDAADAQSWNLYSYVRNNPLRYTDPDGLDYHVCVDNGNGGQNCRDLTDDQYTKLYKQQNGQQGIGLPGSWLGGSISCGSQVCGSARYFDRSMDNSEMVSIGIGATVGGAVAGKVLDWAGSLLGSVFGQIASKTAASTVTDLLAGKIVTGFSAAQRAMLQESLTALEAAGYNTGRLQSLIRMDAPPGYFGMSLLDGAALTDQAFSSQAMLNHTLEHELIHMDQTAAGLRTAYGPGTAQSLEVGADAQAKFPEPQQ